jgi:HK97 family phage major capsid protein
MTPRISPRYPPKRSLTSLEEYRAGVEESSDDWNRSGAPDDLFWRYVLGSPQLSLRQLFNDEEYRVLNKTTTTAGGFLVPQDLEGQIVSAARAESVMARVALELPTESGETLLLPTSTAHGVATWTAESAGYTPSDETFGQASLSAYKATSLEIVTEELLRDAGVSLDAYLAMELGGRMGLLEENAFMNGTGTGQPLGAVHASSPYTVSTAAVGSTLLFKPADILQFYKALPAAYRPNASWIMHPDDLASLGASADTAGGLVFQSLQSGEPTLYGRPVYISPELPAPGVSAKSLLFGDFKRGYAVRRMRGVGVEKLVELYAATGQIGFKAYERVDGRPTLSEAVIIGRHSAT